MSKYDALWTYIKKKDEQSLQLSFDEIRNIVGISIDHSFLNFKKELLLYGYKVNKISIKDEIVYFQKVG